MKSSPRPIPALIAAGLLLAATLAPAAPATKGGANFARTKDRIDALLKHRLKPEPLPAVLPNPFQLSGGTAVAETPPDTTPAPQVPVEPGPPGNDTEALARFVTRLKFGGMVTLNGRLQLVINQSPYKEGDLIFLDSKSAVTYLQVLRITPGEVTLGYNQAVQTVRIKGN